MPSYNTEETVRIIGSKKYKGRSKDTTVRLAREEDFQGVMDINRNVYDGLDYLPDLYHSYLKDPHKHCFVAEIKEQIAGFAIFHVIDDGQTVVQKAGRSDPKLTGHGVMGQMIQEALMYVLARYPRLQRGMWTGINGSLLERIANESGGKLKILVVKKRVTFGATAQDLNALVRSEHFHPLVASETLDKTQLLTPMDALEYLKDTTNTSTMVPEKYLVVIFEPYGLLESNYKSILGSSAFIATFNKDKTKRMEAFSFGTGMTTRAGYRYRIDLYCKEELKNAKTAVAHLLKHIILVNQYQKIGKINFSMLLPKGIDEEEVKRAIVPLPGLSMNLSIKGVSDPMNLIAYNLRDVVPGYEPKPASKL